MKGKWILVAFVIAISAVLSSQVPFKRPSQWLANWFPLNWEAEKYEKGIVTDSIFFHHTAHATELTAEELSAIHKERLYGTRFNSADMDPYVKGEPVTSGHWRIVNGKPTEVYYGYHWFVNNDGNRVRLLLDHEVGWHAGPPKGWDWNMRSIAICLNGDFSARPPSDAALQSAARLLAEYAKTLPLKLVKGHADVRDTKCPGPWFYEKGPDGLTGRERILKLAGITLPE